MVNHGRVFTSILLAAFTAFALGACGAPADSDAPLAYMGDDGDVEEPNPVVPPAPDRTLKSGVLNPPATDPAEKARVLAKYTHLDPAKLVPKNLLEKAVLTFDANPASFPNKNVLGVVDFSKRSNKARWWIVDLKTGSVWAIHVAHGKGSDSNRDGYAEKFSNEHGTNASSLGVYRASETYDSSKFGYSLRVDGLSTTNSNVRDRAIVVHPAWYVRESNVVQGLTAGCLGVSSSLSKKLIDMIRNGSMILVDLSGQTAAGK
ncbi:MAG: murein L,D-transpeptidase catalytic domain family protein [Bdellovibrionota bacterium]